MASNPDQKKGGGSSHARAAAAMEEVDSLRGELGSVRADIAALSGLVAQLTSAPPGVAEAAGGFGSPIVFFFFFFFFFLFSFLVCLCGLGSSFDVSMDIR
jgi:hypothetical protein